VMDRFASRLPPAAFRLVPLAATLLVAAGACQKTERTLREPPPAAARIDTVSLSDLQPGPKLPPVEVKNPYEGNSFAISEGQRLWNWYNCSGCHFRGGGGIGPPLMDKFWIYGGQPDQIFASIVQGRPNGMPAWRGRIPDYQVWQIVAYVETLQADKPIASPPGPREDHLQANPGPQSK
jgi:cytochrome c oxidase cbb3-type subunit 3